MEAVCQKNELGVVTYFSLASGYLSGKYRTKEDLAKSARGKLFIDKYMTEKGVRILSALGDVAAQYNAAMASVALAWIMNKDSVTAPIASATSVAQLDQLAAAASLSLSETDMKLLNEASREN